MKPIDLDSEELKDCYKEAVAFLGIDSPVPMEYVTLASICSKLVLEKFCAKNGIDTPFDYDSQSFPM